MGWGISENANEKEKIKADMGDYLGGLNSTGVIDYGTFSDLYDFSMALLDKMHEQGLKEIEKLNIVLNDIERGYRGSGVDLDETLDKYFHGGKSPVRQDG